MNDKTYYIIILICTVYFIQSKTDQINEKEMDVFVNKKKKRNYENEHHQQMETG